MSFSRSVWRGKAWLALHRCHLGPEKGAVCDSIVGSCWIINFLLCLLISLHTFPTTPSSLAIKQIKLDRFCRMWGYDATPRVFEKTFGWASCDSCQQVVELELSNFHENFEVWRVKRLAALLPLCWPWKFASNITSCWMFHIIPLSFHHYFFIIPWLFHGARLSQGGSQSWSFLSSTWFTWSPPWTAGSSLLCWEASSNRQLFMAGDWCLDSSNLMFLLGVLWLNICQTWW